MKNFKPTTTPSRGSARLSPRKRTGTGFEFPADARFFRAMLCPRGGRLERFAFLFDFRAPAQKRREFNRLRRTALPVLRAKRGDACQLRIAGVCDPATALTVDHVVPLASNDLNKRLRQSKPLPGKKVRAQSFGSNDFRNLALACECCNGHKKHRLDSDLIGRVIRENLRVARRR